ncbi:MAG: hypothetical protein AAF611_10035 [Bacteroidota bacterium]
MKKKKFKNLELYKHKISNLSLLHKKTGGINGTGIANTTYTTGTDADTSDMTTNVTEESICYSYCDDCGTNGGTIKCPPPTEYETCVCDKPSFG